MSAAATTVCDQPRGAIRRPLLVANLAFALLLVLGVELVIGEMHGFSFYGDEWDFLVDRRGTAAKVLLAPHGPHLSLLPILVYKLMLQVFGMRSYGPYKVLAAADLVVLALAVGIFSRRRWGPRWGLVPVGLLVTLGPGAESLLFPFQVGLMTATAAGIVALIAADHGGRRGDTIACAALLVSLASGSQGIGALVGVAVILALAPESSRRVWIVAVPALLYGAWYGHYGHQASQTHIEQWPQWLSYSMQAFSSTLSALIGLGTLDLNPYTGVNPTYGQPLAVGLLVALAVALWRGWRPPRLFWGAVATLVVLLIAASLSNTPMFFRPPETGRYLPVDAALLLVAVVAALPAPRLRGGGRVAVWLIIAVIAATNAGQFAGFRAPYSTTAVPSREALGALLIARGIVAPTFNPGTGSPTVLDNVTAGPFFSAVDAFGTNAYSPAQMLNADEGSRELADGVLVRAERIGITPAAPATAAAPAAPPLLGGSAHLSRGCLVVTGASATVRVPAAGVEITASIDRSANLAMARFGTDFAPSGVVGNLPPGTAGTLRPPPDRARQIPWRVNVNGAGARICSA